MMIYSNSKKMEELIDYIFDWLDDNIDNQDQKALSQDSADLKEKIELFVEGVNDFE
tara:strand:- start:791 stop:958 length:168 start_codon:yes stop_codon:yes gene_type:complete